MRKYTLLKKARFSGIKGNTQDYMSCTHVRRRESRACVKMQLLYVIIIKRKGYAHKKKTKS